MPDRSPNRPRALSNTRGATNYKGITVEPGPDGCYSFEEADAELARQAAAFRAARQAEQAAQAAFATLTAGSKKQRDWAHELRVEMMQSIQKVIARTPQGLTSELVEYERAKDALRTCRDARLIIDNRTSPQYFHHREAGAETGRQARRFGDRSGSGG